MAEVFEIQLSQEQSRFINQQLPKGFSLQFSSQYVRRVQMVAERNFQQKKEPTLTAINDSGSDIGESSIILHDQQLSQPSLSSQPQPLLQQQQQQPRGTKKQDKLNEKQAAKGAQNSSHVLESVLNSSQHNSTGNSQKPNRVSEDMQSCLKLLQQLKKHEMAPPFLHRVDAVALQCPDYYKVIKEPMDMSKVEQNLKQGIYQTRTQFAEDVCKIWKNSFTYNKPASEIYKMTLEISAYFDKMFMQLQNSMPKPLPEHEYYQPQKMTTLAINPNRGQQALNTKGNNKKQYQQQSTNSSLSAAATANSASVPLTQEDKNWVYANVSLITQEETTQLCTMIQSFCPVQNGSMELNLDNLPSRKGREVLQFISNCLKIVPPHIQFKNNKTSATSSSSKKHVISKMDTPLTIKEKQQLGMSIRMLPAEDLSGIWSIVSETQDNSEVIEFNIDTLPVRKARELEKYVKRKTVNQALKQRKSQEQQQPPHPPQQSDSTQQTSFIPNQQQQQSQQQQQQLQNFIKLSSEAGQPIDQVAAASEISPYAAVSQQGQLYSQPPIQSSQLSSMYGHSMNTGGPGIIQQQQQQQSIHGQMYYQSGQQIPGGVIPQQSQQVLAQGTYQQGFYQQNQMGNRMGEYQTGGQAYSTQIQNNHGFSHEDNGLSSDEMLSDSEED